LGLELPPLLLAQRNIAHDAFALVHFILALPGHQVGVLEPIRTPRRQQQRDRERHRERQRETERERGQGYGRHGREAVGFGVSLLLLYPPGEGLER